MVRWKSDGEWEVEGLLTYPVGYTPGTRVPLLLQIHGGPAGAFSQQYLARPNLYPTAAFAARGFAVLQPNPRGSIGYGAKFQDQTATGKLNALMTPTTPSGCHVSRIE